MSDSTNAPDPAGPNNPDVAHEHSDVNVRALFAIGGGLALTLSAVYLVMLWVNDLLAARSARDHPVTFPLAAEENARPLPDRLAGVPAPRLEGLYQQEKPSDRPDVRPTMLRQGQQPALQGYEWIDKGRVARIPIDAAMREVLRRKEFQSPKPAEKGIADRWQGLATPSQPNSGRGAPRDE
jgi:hypothetical protein